MSPEEPSLSGPAAETDPQGGSALQRLRGSLLRPSRGQAVAAVLLAALGFAAVTQARENNASDSYAGLRQSELVQALTGLSATQRRAESDIARLQGTRDSLQDSSQRREVALRQARRETVTLGILAGTLPAQGPGIRITVEDPGGRLSINHLLDGIEELRDAGAEAMEVNDTVRVVAQTSFEDGDGGVVVDGKLLRAPYVIDAIGDPDTLAKALDFPGGFKDDVALDDATISTRRSSSVQVSVTRAAGTPSFAEPAG